MFLLFCLFFTSLQQRGHLETAPPFTVPCEGGEARYIQKEIKLQQGMNGIINYILCKTDLNLIGRVTCKCNTFNNVHFEACFQSDWEPSWFSQFQ